MLGNPIESLITATCPDVGIPVVAPQLSFAPVMVTADRSSAKGMDGNEAASLAMSAWIAVAFWGF